MITMLLFTAITAAAPIAPVTADTTPKAVVTVVAQAAPSSRFDEVICRQLDPTGSRLGAKKVCLTRKSWDDISYGGRKLLEQNQDFRTPPPE